MVPIVTGLFWEFGADRIPDAAIVSEIHGKFSIFEKTQHINLVVPPCRVITFVKVTINNYISKPSVHYDQYKNVVTIEYGLWQFSPSTYDILAKGAWIPGCNPDPTTTKNPTQVPPEQVTQGPNIPQAFESSSMQQTTQAPPLQQAPQRVSISHGKLLFPDDSLFNTTWNIHKVENREDFEKDKDTQLKQNSQNEEDTRSVLVPENEQNILCEQNNSYEQSYETSDEDTDSFIQLVP
uniref:Uncharacterized protein n=1 Tax=Heliothis virescens TaxID=7102 RepID=A0A2A4JLM4_HELVI